MPTSPAGPHQLTATEVMFPGETKRDFSTAPGRTYFFLVKSSARHDAVTGTTAWLRDWPAPWLRLS